VFLEGSWKVLKKAVFSDFDDFYDVLKKCYKWLNDVFKWQNDAQNAKVGFWAAEKAKCYFGGWVHNNSVRAALSIVCFGDIVGEVDMTAIQNLHTFVPFGQNRDRAGVINFELSIISCRLLESFEKNWKKGVKNR